MYSNAYSFLFRVPRTKAKYFVSCATNQGEGVIDTAFDEGKLEGKLERNIEIAKALKHSGISTDIIMKSTGLSKREIEKL